MNRTRKWLTLTASVIAIGAVAFLVGRAWAGGIPAAAALTYSGLLEDAAGALLTGDHPIQVRLWNAATPGTTPLCETQTTQTVAAGRFSMALPDACTDAIKSNVDVWAEVAVDGVSLGTTKLGAVPYAVAADSATTAATANAAGGTLASALSTLQQQVHPASGFHAWLTNPTSVPTAGQTHVVFNHVEFDSGSEYDAATGVFTAKQSGVYAIVCACEYSPAVAGVLYATTILKNGVRIGETDVTGHANGTTPEHTMIAQLAANDAVSCVTGQQTGATVSLHVAESLTHFGVGRLC
jgi:hypothetical protein